METLSAHIHEQPQPLHQVRSDIPRELSDIISLCLEKNPDQRFGNVNELESALDFSV